MSRFRYISNYEQHSHEIFLKTVRNLLIVSILIGSHISVGFLASAFATQNCIDLMERNAK